MGWPPPLYRPSRRPPPSFLPLSNRTSRRLLPSFPRKRESINPFILNIVEG